MHTSSCKKLARRRWAVNALFFTSVAATTSAAIADENPLLEYFQRDTGRVDPALMMERHASVIKQLTGLELTEMPQVISTAPGDVAVNYNEKTASEIDRSDEDRAAAQTRVFKLLGLVPPDYDYEQVAIHSYFGLAGLFDTETKAIHLIERAGRKAQERTLVHEMVHAAQDAAVDLGAYQERYYTSLDARLATASIMEGQAVAVSYIETIEAAGGRDASSVQSEELGDFLTTWTAVESGNFLTELALIPYTLGAQYVLQEYLEHGNTDFRSMLENPPISTEQLIHKDKYLSSDAPKTTRLETEIERLGELFDQDLAYGTTLGELVLNRMLSDPSESGSPSHINGWGGDYIAYFDVGNDDYVLILDTLWDQVSDAESFNLALTQWSKSQMDSSTSQFVFEPIIQQKDERVLMILKTESTRLKLDGVLSLLES